MAEPHSIRVTNVKLEFLRPGPAHNQLLSPLTPYIALCGADGPVTVQMPFEHRQLLTRLARLRYASAIGPGPDEQRQAEVRDIGEIVGKVLGEIPALIAQLGCVPSTGGPLMHLRLTLYGLELGLIPFEAAIAPESMPASGSPLFLQTRIPIAVTREIRRGRALPVAWNQEPRILFAFAAPGELYVPARTHLQALREAIEPWVKIKDPAHIDERIEEVKTILTVLPDASLDKIRRACAEQAYTHVHILAHGDKLKDAGHDRYGIALCSGDRSGVDVIDGERLAIALHTRDSAGGLRSRPTVVTLMTCDSGAIESVVVPGGSIAHELHAAGIPWVIASQFPLWMTASGIATEVLYRSLLKGDDPRWALYNLRQRLRTDCPDTHDWASIVAYAATPWDFEVQVKSFRDAQARRRIDVKFDRIDSLLSRQDAAVRRSDRSVHIPGVNTSQKEHRQELESLIHAIRSDLSEALTDADNTAVPAKRSEWLGLRAASEKRFAHVYSLLDENDLEAKAYKLSCACYLEGFKREPGNHWLLTQYLSLNAILKHKSIIDTTTANLRTQLGHLWLTAIELAEWQISSTNLQQRVWASSSLAELALLGVIYMSPGRQRQQPPITEIRRQCNALLELAAPDDFSIYSTRRQFNRYRTCWANAIWNDLAEEALSALGMEAR